LLTRLVLRHNKGTIRLNIQAQRASHKLHKELSLLEIRGSFALSSYADSHSTPIPIISFSYFVTRFRALFPFGYTTSLEGDGVEAFNCIESNN